MTQQALTFSAEADRKEVFTRVASWLEEHDFRIADQDHERPWGGFFVLDESQAPQFIERFFPHLSLKDFEGFARLSPKFLLVAPGKRLSWQYHHRRSEIWKIMGGSAAVAMSHTDEQGEPVILQTGEIVELQTGQRHRLIGTDGWGVVAEIWRHTDPSKPSDEDDIVRVQDDFGR